MSYLDTLRLHFSGGFFADPSTINNTPANYENQNFDRSTSWVRPGGSWNPEGAHSFRLTNVKVSNAFLSNGLPVNDDPVLHLILESQARNTAKLVDLDTDQQLVSTIFGLKLSLTNDDGIKLMEGIMEPAAFTEIWARGKTSSGDEKACAAYQSVIVVSKWGDLTSSPFLSALKTASPDLLSIKFNLDGYSMKPTSPNFTTGRMVGTIGPAVIGEPKHFIKGRHFDSAAPEGTDIDPGFVPPGGINFCPGVHDKKQNKFLLDLGNALFVNPSKGPIDVSAYGKLFLACKGKDGSTREIGEIKYADADWYEKTAGIVEVPFDRVLTDEENKIIASSVLCITSDKNADRKILIEEANEGMHVRADLFVGRINPGEEISFDFYTTRFGEPLPGATISFGIAVPDSAGNHFPVSALKLPSSVQTDSNGFAKLKLGAGDPGNPRFYYSKTYPREHIDGQIYIVKYGLNEKINPNPSDKLSILVWNNFIPDDPITWHGSLKAVMKQYGDLYPIMTKDQHVQLDLADYEQISKHRLGIMRVITLPETDPMYMPVTRDMSKSKREALLKWLTDIGTDGKPLLGAERKVRSMHAKEIPVDKTGSAEPAKGVDLGGKTIFANNLDKISQKLVKPTSND